MASVVSLSVVAARRLELTVVARVDTSRCTSMRDCTPDSFASVKGVCMTATKTNTRATAARISIFQSAQLRLGKHARSNCSMRQMSQTESASGHWFCGRLSGESSQRSEMCLCVMSLLKYASEGLRGTAHDEIQRNSQLTQLRSAEVLPALTSVPVQPVFACRQQL